MHFSPYILLLKKIISSIISLSIWKREDKELQKKLTRSYSENEDYLNPIFYSQYNKEDIEELIGEDDLFKIAGITPGVNYQL